MGGFLRSGFGAFYGCLKYLTGKIFLKLLEISGDRDPDIPGNSDRDLANQDRPAEMGRQKQMHLSGNNFCNKTKIINSVRTYRYVLRGEKKMLTGENKIQTYHIWRRALSETRIDLTKQFVSENPGIIQADQEWSDLLCLRIETLKSIIG